MDETTDQPKAKSIYNAMETDERLELDGVLLDFGDYGRFRIARAGGRNQAFNARSMAVLKPHRRLIDKGLYPIERIRQLLAPVYAEHVVRGWDGVVDRAGVTIPYTFENAKRLLTDLPDLFDTIRAEAEELSNYLLEEVDAAVKNS